MECSPLGAKIVRSAILAAGLALTATPAIAQTPAELADLMYQDAGWARQQVEQRGYRIVRSDARVGEHILWNASRNHCVELKVADRKVSSVRSIDRNVCTGNAQGDGAQGGGATPGGFHDLIGMRSAYLDSEMQNRGFRNVGGLQGGGAARTTWWNAQRRQCVSVVTRNGQVDEIHAISTSSCRGGEQDVGSGHANLNDLVGMRSANLDQEMSGHGYRNVGGSQGGGAARTIWWNAQQRHCVMVVTRNARVDEIQSVSASSCRHDNTPSAGGGQGGLGDLRGASARNLDTEMQSRGYVWKGGYQDAGAAHAMWYNPRNRHCVSVVTRNGRVDNIESIAEGNCQ